MYTLHSLYLWISKDESSRHPGRGVSACIFPALTSPAQGPIRVASVLLLLSFPSTPAASHPSPAIPPLCQMSHPVTKGGSRLQLTIEWCPLKPKVTILNPRYLKWPLRLLPLIYLCQETLRLAGKQTPLVAYSTAISPSSLVIDT